MTKRVQIAHYQTVWLPPTMTWLLQLITDLQEHAGNMVIADRKEHGHAPESFPVYALNDLSLLFYWSERLMMKTGIRKTPFFLQAQLKKKPVHLLHSHFGHIAWKGSLLAEKAGIPHVASFYGMDLMQIPRSDPAWYSRYLEMFDKTKLVFCEGPHMAQSIRELGCPEEKVVVHALGIDTEKISFSERNWKGTETLGILIAASFREKKGIPLAIRALGALKDRFPLKITLVGEASQDPESILEKARIRRAISESGLESLVHCTGYCTHGELLGLAEDCHIFLSPSQHAANGDSEGGAPVGLIEMAASGLIVVSTRHADIPRVILDRKTGWLAEEKNLDDLVDCLLQAISAHRRWPEIGRAAREHILTHFNAGTQAFRLFEHYRRVLRL